MDCLGNRAGSATNNGRLPLPPLRPLVFHLPLTPSSTEWACDSPVLSSLGDREPWDLGPGRGVPACPPGTVGLLFEPGDSLWIPVTDAAGGQLRGLQPRFRAGSSLLWPPPALALSNFSPMLLLRSCVSPAYSVWTAADCILLVTRSRCPPAGAHPCLPAHSFSAFLLSSTDRSSASGIPL